MDGKRQFYTDSLAINQITLSELILTADFGNTLPTQAICPNPLTLTAAALCGGELSPLAQHPQKSLQIHNCLSCKKQLDKNKNFVTVQPSAMGAVTAGF